MWNSNVKNEEFSTSKTALLNTAVALDIPISFAFDTLLFPFYGFGKLVHSSSGEASNANDIKREDTQQVNPAESQGGARVPG